MVTSTKPRPQMALEETTLDDPSGELERLLDECEAANDARKPYQRDYSAKRALAKAAVEKVIKERELGFGEYRCGDIIVVYKRVEEREVEFKLASTTRLTFKPAKS